MYQYMIKDLPEDERPRERLERKGPKVLSNIELLAILIRTGSRQKSAINLAEEIMRKFSNLYNLRNITIDELMMIKGIGKAKAIQILAAIELGSRMSQYVLERGM